MILSLFGLVVLTTGRFVLSCLALCFRVLQSCLAVITSLGEERAGLCDSRVFVCLFYTRQFLSLFSSSLCQGLTAACDCGTSWSFLLFV